MEKIKKRYSYSLILLREFSRTDFKLRYEGSTLGYAWSVLKPLSLFAVLYLVFGVFLPFNKGIPNFPVYLILGIVLWSFFVEVTKTSTGAIVARTSLIRKISFPRYVIVVSVTVSALINLAISMGIVLVFLLFSNVTVTTSVFYMIPILIQLLVLSFGMGLILSTLYVRYRDINFVWDVLVQALFYAVPIIYDIMVISPQVFQKVMMINPIAQIIQDARAALLSQDVQTISDVYGSSMIRLIPIGITVGVLVLGIFMFRKYSPFFAEEV